MANERSLRALLMAAMLLASSIPGILAWSTAPARAAPASEVDSWSDSFDVPSEWDGIGDSENVTVQDGSVMPDWEVSTGTGADGDRSVSGAVYADSVRTCVTTNSYQGQDFVIVGSVAGIALGDEVLLMQMTGTTAGSYEFARVSGLAGTCVTLAAPLWNSFSSSTSRSQLIRVPQYEALTVQPGGVLTCSPWDGNTGGVLCFRARGSVTVSAGGAIDASGKGFGGGSPGTAGQGGAGGTGGDGGPQRGGAGVAGATGTGGGNGGNGGTGPARAGGKGGDGGGSGNQGTKGAAGKNGAGPAGGAPGQGGANPGPADFSTIQLGDGGGGGTGGTGGAGAGGGGGGGGGYNAGNPGTAGERGGNGGTAGSGGTGGGIVLISAGSIKVDGSLLASGTPGTAGTAGNSGGAGGKGGQGGATGGGFGNFVYDGGGGGGGNGASGGSGGTGGGGGGGGSIRLTALQLALGQNRVSGAGGAGGGGGGGGVAGPAGTGGAAGGGQFANGAAGVAGHAGSTGTLGTSGTAGGAGRVRLEAVDSSGVAQPAGSAVKIGRHARGSVTSIPVTPPSLGQWESFDVVYSLEPGSSIDFELLDNLSGEVIDRWASSGDGQESFNLSGVSAGSVKLRAILFADGTNTPSLDHWSIFWVTNHPPMAPSGLSVDTYPAGSPRSLNLTSHLPVFNWTFNDPDAGQLQGAVELSVWTGPGGTGSLAWKLEANTSAQTATYGAGGSAALALLEGTDYFMSLRTRDSALIGATWSPTAELRFHINQPPGVPPLASPANGSVSVGIPAALEWSASQDREGSPVIYDWQVGSAQDFGSLRANASTNRTIASVELTAGTKYFWRVRASDGYEASGWSEVRSFTVSSDKGPRVSPIPPLTLYFNESRDLNLSAYGSDDKDGKNLTWEAALTDGPNYTATPPPLKLAMAGQILRLTAGGMGGLFIVTVKAVNSRGFKTAAIMSVTVAPTPPNNPPVMILDGASIKAGTTMRIDLLKYTRDEDPSSLRWDVTSNNTLLVAGIEGSHTLFLQAGAASSNTNVTVRVRVHDKYNLTDEANPEFLVLASRSGGQGPGFPWAILVGVLAVVAVLALAVLFVMRRKTRQGAAPEAKPVQEEEEEVLQMEEHPSFREGPVPPPSEEAPVSPALAPAPTEDALTLPARLTVQPQAARATAAPAPGPRPLPPPIKPPEEELWSPEPEPAPLPLTPSVSKTPVNTGGPESSVSDIPDLQPLEELPPEKPAPAPAPAPRPGKAHVRDLDEILRLLQK